MTYVITYSYKNTSCANADGQRDALNVSRILINCCTTVQWRNDGVAAASSDGGPTGGRGPRQFYFILNHRGGALT